MRDIPNDYLTENPILDPTAESFLNSLSGPPIYTLPVDEARGVLRSAQSGQVKLLSASTEDFSLQNGVLLRVVRPMEVSSRLPVVMYFHGGGWVLGDGDTHDRLVRELANGVEAAVVFVDYSRAPEAQFPQAIEECYEAIQWVVENGPSLNLDVDRMAVVGDSAGGAIATALTMLIKERGGPEIALQVLFYPVTNANFETDSYRQFSSGYFLEKEGMRWFWDLYAPNELDRLKATASPLQASVAHLQGLPPALVVTGECDVLRDEGEAYARKLTAAGVRVTAARFLGTIHDFVMLNALSSTPATRGAIALAIASLRSAFSEQNARRLSLQEIQS